MVDQIVSPALGGSYASARVAPRSGVTLLIPPIGAFGLEDLISAEQ